MSTIKEQVEKLRATARGCEPTYGGKNKQVYVAVDGVNSSYLKNILDEAADTIESLSAQLQKSNMEQSEEPIERFEWIKKNRGERPKHLAQTHDSKL